MVCKSRISSELLLAPPKAGLLSPLAIHTSRYPPLEEPDRPGYLPRTVLRRVLLIARRALLSFPTPEGSAH
jgi:hypothetical protein